MCEDEIKIRIRILLLIPGGKRWEAHRLWTHLCIERWLRSGCCPVCPAGACQKVQCPVVEWDVDTKDSDQLIKC